MKIRLFNYIDLMRLDRPIGIWLLLWPVFWALWLAAKGWPGIKLFLIFTTGAVLMRSVGCIASDLCDRRFDGLVERTKGRPIVSGRVSTFEAVILLLLLCLSASLLVLFLDLNVILMTIPALLLALTYPLAKRIMHFPQIVLGLAFGWGIPMAYVAVLGSVPLSGWCLYLAVILWAVVYDSMYAMVDRDDSDRAIPIKITNPIQ